MNRFHLWIIEARNPDGSLALGAPQPNEVFGEGAIHGMTTDRMAKIIFRHKPDAVMHGTNIPNWPKLINPLWTARRKTW